MNANTHTSCNSASSLFHIQDACDENSWDRVGDEKMYPISNSCGQLGQSYQVREEGRFYHAHPCSKHFACAIIAQNISLRSLSLFRTITAVKRKSIWNVKSTLT